MIWGGCRREGDYVGRLQRRNTAVEPGERGGFQRRGGAVGNDRPKTRTPRKRKWVTFPRLNVKL